MERIQLPPHKTATFVLAQYRLVYVSVPKAACTSVKWLLADLAGEDTEAFRRALSQEVTRGTAIHRRSLWRNTPMLHQLPAEELAEISAENGWMIFALTRHPTIRLWSAWQSKLLMQEPSWLGRFGGADWLPRVPSTTEDVVEDFHKFVVSVAADPGHPIMRDRHFIPQVDLLNAGLTPYTHLYDTSKFSTMTADLETHLRAHGWDGTFHLSRSNETPLQPIRRVFPEDVVSAIAQLYAKDFLDLQYQDPVPPKILDDPEYPPAAIHSIGMLVERGERIHDLANLAKELSLQIKESAAADEQSREHAQPDAPESSPGAPIFLLGSMGSGTTLLRLILDSHENIAIAQETGFMRAVLANKWIPFWKFGQKWYARLGWTDDEFDAALSKFYGGIFARFAEQQGKRRWGDKTPYHTWHIQEAARVFPDAVFIATVRHPGATAASVRTRFGYTWRKSINHWKRSNTELALRGAELGNRFLLCRYEDLVLHTEQTLRELLDCIDEPWSPDLLQHHLVHSERGTPAQVEGRTRSDEPVDATRISKWAQTMDKAALRMLHDEVAPLARYYGYDTEDASGLAPLLPDSGERRLVMSGEDMAARRADFSDIVDWSYAPRPSRENRFLDPKEFMVAAVPAATPSAAVSDGTTSARPNEDAADRKRRGLIRALRPAPHPAPRRRGKTDVK